MSIFKSISGLIMVIGVIVSVGKGEEVKKAVSKNLPFEVKISRVSSWLDLEFPSSQTRLDLLLSWNDKVEPILIDTLAHNLEVIYEGKSLKLEGTKGKSLAPVDSINKLGFLIDLPYLKRNKEAGFLIKGNVRAIVPIGFELVEFGKLSKLVLQAEKDLPTFVKDKFSCRVKKVLVTSARITFTVQVEMPEGKPEFDTSQNWAVLNQLKLLQNKTGKDWPADGYVLDVMENTTALISYHFLLKDKAMGDFSDWSLNYKSATGMKFQEIPFQFDSIPLP